MVGNIKFPNEGEKIVQLQMISHNKVLLVALTNYGNLYRIIDQNIELYTPEFIIEDKGESHGNN